MKIAVLQYEMYWEQIGENLMMLNQILAELHTQTELLILPEMFQTGFSMNREKLAEPPDGITFKWAAQLASASNIAVCGSWMVRENDKFFNRFHFIRPDGKYTTYDKQKLFTPGNEHLHYTSGNEQVTFEFKGWKICPMICYDLRFPELARAALPFDLLIYVASWPEKRVNAWSTLLQARAIENQCYTVGSNRVGEDGNGINHVGLSAVYQFDGAPILKTGSETDIFYADLSLEALKDYRITLPFLSDRGPITLG